MQALQRLFSRRAVVRYLCVETVRVAMSLSSARQLWLRRIAVAITWLVERDTCSHIMSVVKSENPRLVAPGIQVFALMQGTQILMQVKISDRPSHDHDTAGSWVY